MGQLLRAACDLMHAPVPSMKSPSEASATPSPPQAPEGVYFPPSATAFSSASTDVEERDGTTLSDSQDMLDFLGSQRSSTPTTSSVSPKEDLTEIPPVYAEVVSSTLSSPSAPLIVDDPPEKRRRVSWKILIILGVITTFIISACVRLMLMPRSLSSSSSSLSEELCKDSNALAEEVVSTIVPVTSSMSCRMQQPEQSASQYLIHWVKKGGSISFGPDLDNEDLDEIRAVAAVPANLASALHDPSLASSYVPLRWRKNGKDIVDGTSGELPRRHLTLLEASHEDAGDYECYVKLKTGKERILARTIVLISEPPSVKSKPLYSEIKVSSRLILQLQAQGIPTPSFEWFKNGFRLSSEYQQLQNTLLVDSVNKTHTGTYSCLLRNIAGEFLWLEATVVVRD